MNKDNSCKSRRFKPDTVLHCSCVRRKAIAVYNMNRYSMHGRNLPSLKASDITSIGN